MMTSPISQLNLPPRAVERLAAPQATQGNPVAAPVEQAGICLVDVVNAAAAHLGYQHGELGSIFGGLSVAEVSKNFGPNNPDRNRLMKERLPMPFARQVALAMCEATGLVVSGADAERHALADVLRACSDYVRVVSR
jgi:hypothetical protein